MRPCESKREQVGSRLKCDYVTMETGRGGSFALQKQCAGGVEECGSRRDVDIMTIVRSLERYRSVATGSRVAKLSLRMDTRKR